MSNERIVQSPQKKRPECGIPNDIWTEIFLYLITTQSIKTAIRNILSVGVVSSQFNVLCSNMIRSYLGDFKQNMILKFPEMQSFVAGQAKTISVKNLSALTNLTDLNVRECGLSLKLFPLTNLNTLAVTSHFRSMEKFQFLERLTSLTNSLPLEDCQVQHLTNLKHFDSRIQHLTNRKHFAGHVTTQITKLTQLESLTIEEQSSIAEPQLSKVLPVLTRLKVLVMKFAMRARSIEDKAISGLTDLTELDLRILLDLTSKAIQPLTKLNKLCLISTIDDDSVFRHCPNVTSLRWYCGYKDRVPQLSYLTNLLSLSLPSNVSVPNSLLEKLTDLTELDLSNDEVGISSETLKKLTKLTFLELEDYSRGAKIKPDFCSSLTNLTYLSLYQKIEESEVWNLSYLTNLVTLKLSNNFNVPTKLLACFPFLKGNYTDTAVDFLKIAKHKK